MPRIRGAKTARTDYRHVIWSLVKKPGAFARYRQREELFPTLAFRQAYDALRERLLERADVEYVRILHLTASTFESRIEQVLLELLGSGSPSPTRAGAGANTPRAESRRSNCGT